MTESLDSRRLDLVRAAQQQWIAALTDLGGRNTLLYYKDRRASTLDLAQADPEAMDRFTGTGSIRLTRLFKDVDLRADGWRFHRLWSTNWFNDPDAEVARLREAYDKAVAASPPPSRPSRKKPPSSRTPWIP